MKFCYIDESGNSSHNTISVMAGMLVDFTKVNKHSGIFRDERDKLFSEYHSVNGSTKIDEVKTYQIYEGKKNWSKVDADIRKEFIKNACRMCERIPCEIVFSVVSFKKYNEAKHGLKPALKGIWQWQACHLILQIQAQHFKIKGNKGNTLVIFDDHHGDMDVLYEAFNGSADFHSFYSYCVSRKKKILKKEENLNQIIDLLSVESKSSIFIQLSDVFAYILRRHVELSSGEPELCIGDKAFTEECFKILKPKIIYKDKYWNQKVPVCELLSSIAPRNLKTIIKSS